MPSHYDAGDWDIIVGGQLMSEFGGASGFKQDTNVTPIMATGRRRVGVNRTRNANGADFSFTIKRSSKDDLQYLEDLVASQVEVPVKVLITKNLDSYLVGQEVAFGCQFGALMGGTRGAGGEEAEDVEYQVVGRGQIREFKQ